MLPFQMPHFLVHDQMQVLDMELANEHLLHSLALQLLYESIFLCILYTHHTPFQIFQFLHSYFDWVMALTRWQEHRE